MRMPQDPPRRHACAPKKKKSRSDFLFKNREPGSCQLVNFDWIPSKMEPPPLPGPPPPPPCAPSCASAPQLSWRKRKQKVEALMERCGFEAVSEAAANAYAAVDRFRLFLNDRQSNRQNYARISLYLAPSRSRSGARRRGVTSRSPCRRMRPPPRTASTPPRPAANADSLTTSATADSSQATSLILYRKNAPPLKSVRPGDLVIVAASPLPPLRGELSGKVPAPPRRLKSIVLRYGGRLARVVGPLRIPAAQVADEVKQGDLFKSNHGFSKDVKQSQQKTQDNTQENSEQTPELNPEQNSEQNPITEPGSTEPPPTRTPTRRRGRSVERLMLRFYSNRHASRPVRTAKTLPPTAKTLPPTAKTPPPAGVQPAGVRRGSVRQLQMQMSRRSPDEQHVPVVFVTCFETAATMPKSTEKMTEKPLVYIPLCLLRKPSSAAAVKRSSPPTPLAAPLASLLKETEMLSRKISSARNGEAKSDWLVVKFKEAINAWARGSKLFAVERALGACVHLLRCDIEGGAPSTSKDDTGVAAKAMRQPVCGQPALSALQNAVEILQRWHRAVQKAIQTVATAAEVVFAGVHHRRKSSGRLYRPVWAGGIL